MKRIGKKMCEICKENISKGIIHNKFVCMKCYLRIKDLQAMDGYSKEFFKRHHLKPIILTPTEIIKEVKKNHTVGSS